MARVPYTAIPDASPELQAPEDLQHEEASPAAFGSALAEGAQAAGAGAFKLEDALNETKVLGASNDLADFVADQQKGFRSLQGQNAIDAYPDFKSGLEEKEQEIGESMPTLNARNAFAANSRRFVQGALDDAGEHIAGETLKLQDSTALGGIQATTNAAIANRNTPGALQTGISTVAAQTADYLYRIKGVRDPDAIHAGVQQQVSGLVGDAITTAMNDVGAGTLPEQQKALANAQDMFKQATAPTTGSIPGSPGVPLLDAKTNDELGQKIAYREWTISQRADRVQEKDAANFRVSVTHSITDASAMVESGVPIHGQLPTDAQIDAAYPEQPDQASVMKDQRDMLATMSNYLGVLPEATPAQIVKLRQEAQADPSKPDYAKALAVQHGLDAAINARNKALSDDPASYLVTTNPDIGRAWDAAQANPAAFGAYAHQVQVTLGTIGVPTEQQSLLPGPAAKGYVQSIEGDPAGAPGKMQQMQAQYGAYWPQVWRDLVQRGGMSPQYQAVGIIDPANGALLARALSEPGKSGKDVSELIPQGAAGKITSAVRVNPAVQSLTRSLMASDGSAAQAATVESSIDTLTYANMAYKGMDQATALTTAVKAFTGQYRFVPDGGARIPADKFDTVMANASATLSGLSVKSIAVPGGSDKAATENAIITQESHNNPNERTSTAGAVGIGQILPATFARFARPGESIANAADNRAVSARAIDHYYDEYGGDTSRVAVAYFSGEGNVAPAGSATPWRTDAKDTNGKTTSSYVGDVQGRLGGQIFGNLGGPTGADYVRAVQAAPNWITSPNADALWLVDHYGRVVRQPNGQPVSVKFNAPPPPASRLPEVGHAPSSYDIFTR